MVKRIGSLIVPEVQGVDLKPNYDNTVPTIDATQERLSAMAFDNKRVPIYQQMTELHQLLYGEITNPPYDEKRISKSRQAEINRHILLFADVVGAVIPEEYRLLERYATANTETLLLELFDENQLQTLQGILVFTLLERRNPRSHDLNNTLTVGGLVYTQKQMKGILRLFDAPKGAREDILDVLTNNVKGVVHYIPFGETKKVEGKGAETMFMFCDDIIKLWEAMYKVKNNNINPPRYVIGATNVAMGEATKRLLGTKVEIFDFSISMQERLMQMVTQMLGIPNSQQHREILTVFINSDSLEKLRSSVEPSRQELYLRLRQNDDEPMSETLKRIRAEAITHITELQQWNMDGLE